MEVLFRVLVGAAICVAPTVLFVGFWRGLQRMQNGEFVERVADHHGATVDDLLPGAHSEGSRVAERRALRGTFADGVSDAERWETDPARYPDDFEKP